MYAYISQKHNLIVITLLALLIAGCAKPSSIKPIETIHLINSGDSLSNISLKYTGSMDNYQAIADYNGIKNVNMIPLGVTIRIPPHLLSDNYQKSIASVKTPLSSRSSNSVTTDTKKTTVEGVALGAFLGATLGYFACNNRNRTACALAGAAAGAALGGVAGKEVAKRKQAYASTEQYLDSEITSAKGLNKELEKNHEQQLKRLEMLNQDVYLMKKDYQQSKISADQLSVKQIQIRKAIEENTEMTKAIMAELEVKKVAARGSVTQSRGGDPRTESLEREIALLQKNLDDLQSSTQQLAQLDKRLRI